MSSTKKSKESKEEQGLFGAAKGRKALCTSLSKSDLEPFFKERPGRLFPEKIEIRNPKCPHDPKVIEYGGWEAYLPPEPEVPRGFKSVGGWPVKVTEEGPILPDKRIRDIVGVREWKLADWKIWNGFLPTVNLCIAVPAKSGRVEVPVLPLTRMGKVSGDCARIYTMSNLGCGCVVNVITERVEAAFNVKPNPNPTPPHPAGLIPIVHPFTKGGINHKYKRLYVPASFYAPGRSMSESGFYVAVIDVDPTSASYLDTIDWINCGWIPEEIDFTDDNEKGVIANYMQGTVTVFEASSGNILAAEVDGFPGAGANLTGGPWARSVRCGYVPGIGNRAYLTLTSGTGNSGLAVFDLDTAGFPRTNISLPSSIVGVALTPDRRHALAVGGNKLTVVKIDVPTPVVQSTINLPTSGGQSYWGGIEVRPSGNLAFIATGNANSTSSTQGTTLIQVDYMSGTTLENPTGLASQTWNLDFARLGGSLKPHIIVTSISGMVTIIPC